jgi:hypothetical protein
MSAAAVILVITVVTLSLMVPTGHSLIGILLMVISKTATIKGLSHQFEAG